MTATHMPPVNYKDPVQNALGRRIYALEHQMFAWPAEQFAEDDSDEDIAARLHWSRRHVQRKKRAGWISFYVADYVATRLGFHPAELWPEWSRICDDLLDTELELDLAQRGLPTEQETSHG